MKNKIKAINKTINIGIPVAKEYVITLLLISLEIVLFKPF
jgi:hypothetical protein